MENQNLTLKIMKEERHKCYRTTFMWFYFSLYDSNGYVCLMPQEIVSCFINKRNHTTYLKIVEIFGFDKAKIISKSLLEKALTSETDTDIKAEIQRRLAKFEPKQHKKWRLCECKKHHIQNPRYEKCWICRNKKKGAED